ncbi:MAG: tRNA (cytidine(34)-2'-O)-methyltransferase [Defluviitaleaceae bacterium]|nr:tRNA (cytidine(34)-2'-O)-methyltransferase [Defluviitaleaceae bacterium]
MPLHVALYQPEIPPNTGNIARTCVATHVTLHLIHPLGFNIDTKTARRAGMDYWEHAIVCHYESLDDLFTHYPTATFYLIETGGNKVHTDVDFSNVEEDIFFIFGKESSGLPKTLLAENVDKILTIPMTNQVRSLNLSNTAAILIYEALRQQHYAGIK